MQYPSSKAQGAEFEKAARHYLQKQGLTFVAANQHCKYGEIDLIMQEKETLVFVEVRQRRHYQFGSALESVNYQKQQKLLKTANYWLAQHNLSLDTADCRFDLVTFDGKDNKINWLINFIEIND